MDAIKLQFLKTEFIPLLQSIDPHAKPQWGLMNVQQMIEHMSDSVRIANGRVLKEVITPSENLPKFKAFMLSEKPFRENTKNVELPESPSPVRNENIESAMEELGQELKCFFNVFETSPGKIITNPIFGELNYTEWVHLLHKHSIHHLKQFNAI